MPGFYLPNEDEFDPNSDDFVSKCETSERNYKHFDLPLSDKERKKPYVLSANSPRHRFWPLLGYSKSTRKYLIGPDDEKIIKSKDRPIRFASHADAAYLQAYAEWLSNWYERSLAADEISSSVLAYRKGGSTNIHHAKSLFDEIRSRGDCQVFALDISGFFDNLNHEHLRRELCGILDAGGLDGHHWDVFKNITRYSWVDTAELDRVLGRKRNGKGRICSPDDYRKHVRSGGLIKKHQFIYGIPQGTPVSGLYANIYLRTFDREMISFVKSHGGSYRRYSDDIAIVLPIGFERDNLVDLVRKRLSSFHLEISEGKTETATFMGGKVISEKPIQYLGFTFDGDRTLIRASSLDAYRAKMRRGIHAKLVAAKKKRIASHVVYKRELLSKYTHLGIRRNFIQYAYKASDIMSSREIREQVKHHMKWFGRAWGGEVDKVYGGLVKAA